MGGGGGGGAGGTYHNVLIILNYELSKSGGARAPPPSISATALDSDGGWCRLLTLEFERTYHHLLHYFSDVRSLVEPITRIEESSSYCSNERSHTHSVHRECSDIYIILIGRDYYRGVVRQHTTGLTT